jgi:hypothetical protein
MAIPVSLAERKTASDPTREYVSAGTGAYGLNSGLTVAAAYDDVVRQFGSRVYALMALDPAIATALWLLKAGAIADGLKISPAMKPAEGEIVRGPKRRSQLKLSEEIFASCQRVVDRVQDQVETGMYEMLDMLHEGNTAAELVFDLDEDGEDQGRLVPTFFQVIPKSAYEFKVQKNNRVEALNVWTEDGWVQVERDHFMLMAWRPKSGDPRGTVLIRPCYTPFNTKLQVYPDYGQYLKTYASPSVVLIAGPEMEDKDVRDPVSGNLTTVTVQQQMVNAGKSFRNSSVLGLPHGCQAMFPNFNGGGRDFVDGLDRIDRELFQTVILSARPLQEAQHGSKADSESGLDVFGMAVSQVRNPMKAAFRRDFLKRYVTLNWGPQIAAEHTPFCEFGIAEHISPDLMKAFADAWTKGLFVESHRPTIWSKLGFPTPPGWKPGPEQPRKGQDPKPDPEPGQDPEPGPGTDPDKDPADPAD